MIQRGAIPLLGLTLWCACLPKREFREAGTNDLPAEVADATVDAPGVRDAQDASAIPEGAVDGSEMDVEAASDVGADRDGGIDAADGDDADAGPRCDLPTLCTEGECASVVRKIAIGRDHACALKNNGLVYCWGSNREGQLGVGVAVAPTSSGTPLMVRVTEAVDIAAGPSDTCVALRDGGVSCWGSNFFGGFGDGVFVDAAVPDGAFGVPAYEGAPSGGYARFDTPHAVELSRDGVRLPPVCQVASGQSSKCVVTADARLFCWGFNDGGRGYGHLGGGDLRAPDGGLIVFAHRPEVVRAEMGLGEGTHLTGVRHVSMFSTTTCALREVSGGSEVRCWGACVRGRCGTGGERLLQYAGESVRGLRNPSALSVGESHSCALVPEDGGQRAYCWGQNRSGQTGTTGGWSACQLEAGRVVVEAASISRIFAGGVETCAALPGGLGLRCWGAAGHQWLASYRAADAATNNCPNAGDIECMDHPDAGRQSCAFAPLDIRGDGVALTSVTQLAFSEGFRCLVNGGQVYCMGSDANTGRLGQGPNPDASEISLPYPTLVNLP